MIKIQLIRILGNRYHDITANIGKSDGQSQTKTRKDEEIRVIKRVKNEIENEDEEKNG